jgi:hypothetical protein
VFTPSLHPRGAGGKFAAKAGGGSAAAPKKTTAKTAKTTPAAAPAPNGLGYSGARWKQLQALEAAAKSGTKLDAHQQHELHAAHQKRLAALAKAPRPRKAGVAAVRKTGAVKAAAKKKPAPARNLTQSAAKRG